MEILKIQCMDAETARKCAEEFNYQNIKHIQLGSAICVLSNMHNATRVTNIYANHGAHTVGTSEYDETALLNSL